MSSSDVVVVSRFGAKAGGTPGNYIRRYSARLDATEALTPYTTLKDLSAYQQAYNDRNGTADEIIEGLGTDEALVMEDERVTDQSARLFGSDGLVYSRNQFTQAVRNTEKALEEGHTLITPVVSFSHEYLKERGVIMDDMDTVTNNEDEGAYRGQIDQLKLRRAITNGMGRLCTNSHFVKPEWTAAIQVDTANVHVHVTLIETCDMEDIPKERFVYSPAEELRVTHSDNGLLEQERVPILDRNGKQQMNNLGERGKLLPKATRAFREGIDQELIRLTPSRPFINDLSAHTRLVKQNSSHLSLEHTALSSQLVQIYEALPKGDTNDTYMNQDKSIRSEQPNWRAKSNRVSMKKPNKLAYEYVDRLIEDHRSAIGYDSYEQAVEQYTETKAPDLPNTDYSAERDRLKQVVSDRLREEMVNDLYKSLKPLRIVNDKEAFEKVQSEQLDDRERVVIEGQLTPKGLQLALLDDEQLKDLIADNLDDDDTLISGSLGIEKRLRDYPSRFTLARDKEKHYSRLKEGYDKLASTGNTTDESAAMKELFDSEEDYFGGVRDKYAFLMDQRQKTHLQYKGVKYPDVKDNDLSTWVDTVHSKVKDIVEKQSDGPLTEAQLTDITASERLPEEVVVKLQDEAGDTPLNQAVKHQSSIRAMTRIYDGLMQQVDTRAKYTGVSKERFNEVKGYDLIETIYDFDATSTRNVSDTIIETYDKVQTRRKQTFDNALEYLNGTNQNTLDYPEYLYYREEADGVNQALDFVDVVKRSSKLPKPLRRHHETDNAMEKLATNRVLPANEAKEFNRDFLEVSIKTVNKSKESIVDHSNDINVDEDFTLDHELIRLNQMHASQLREAQQEEEAERLEKEEEKLLRAVPNDSVKVTEGELDRSYVRELFKEKEKKLLPRYVSSYYETSYDDPGVDI